MPCAEGELCLVPGLTPERPDGPECRGERGGRLHGLCGEADPDCDNPMQRICHYCLAAKQCSKDVADKRKAGKPQAGKRKASDEMTEKLNGTHVTEVNVHEIKDSDDDTTGRGGGAPSPLNARMSFIRAHASKPAQQADTRQFCEPQGQGRGHSGGPYCIIVVSSTVPVV